MVISLDLGRKEDSEEKYTTEIEWNRNVHKYYVLVNFQCHGLYLNLNLKSNILAIAAPPTQNM